MSIEKLKSELRKFVEFDERAAQEYAKRNVDLALATKSTTIDCVREGARWQHTKSARYAEHLLECVEVLETMVSLNAHELNTITKDGCLKLAEELLAKLSKGDGA